ncbi:hypothetical protein E2C01_061933 [Portunus trituberculatus]|uniref:Uncharacterized protein n=1 Tax=Portunus trituberculatus TaxID=210409 RepID=A0A5B7H6L2_PORTR|nr:hypothetical protein [Portunus trituberculatus]
MKTRRSSVRKRGMQWAGAEASQGHTSSATSPFIHQMGAVNGRRGESCKVRGVAAGTESVVVR